jgi:hypothetical protein
MPHLNCYFSHNQIRLLAELEVLQRLCTFSRGSDNSKCIPVEQLQSHQICPFLKSNYQSIMDDGSSNKLQASIFMNWASLTSCDRDRRTCMTNKGWSSKLLRGRWSRSRRGARARSVALRHFTDNNPHPKGLSNVSPLEWALYRNGVCTRRQPRNSMGCGRALRE